MTPRLAVAVNFAQFVARANHSRLSLRQTNQSTNCMNALFLSILTAIFPGGPGLASTRMSQFWVFGAKDDWSGGDNWSYKTCKAPVKMSPPTNKHQSFLQAGCPSCRLTNSVKALKGKLCEVITQFQPCILAVHFCSDKKHKLLRVTCYGQTHIRHPHTNGFEVPTSPTLKPLVSRCALAL